MDRIEQDFRDALGRLEAQQPTNEKLIGRLARKGYVPINVSTVSLEAGRSRTLVGVEKCRYPETRKLIVNSSKGADLRGPAIEALSALREENRLLSEKLNRAYSEQAALLNGYRKLKRELCRVKARGKREEDAAAKTAKIVPIR